MCMNKVGMSGILLTSKWDLHLCASIAFICVPVYVCADMVCEFVCSLFMTFHVGGRKITHDRIQICWTR